MEAELCLFRNGVLGDQASASVRRGRTSPNGTWVPPPLEFQFPSVPSSDRSVRVVRDASSLERLLGGFGRDSLILQGPEPHAPAPILLAGRGVRARGKACVEGNRS